MVTKKKVVKPKKEDIKNEEIERDLNIPEIITVKRKINWIGINRKIREYGRLLKIYNLNLPEFKFIFNIISKCKSGWNKYTEWWNRKVNHGE